MNSLHPDTDKKILIVEDEFVLANGLELILLQAGYKVLGIAGSVEEAESYLLHSRPDLAILDIRLNGKKSGLELAKRLKAENIAFIFLSANSSQNVLKEVKVTEPYGFIVKPFREKDLLVTLDIAFYRHQFSLESQLRREELLHTKIKDLHQGPLSFNEKVSALARILQGNLPFDVFLATGTGIKNEEFRNSGLVRTAYNQYQQVEENLLDNILGKLTPGWSLTNEGDMEPCSYLHPQDTRESQHEIDEAAKALFSHFKAESCLSFLLPLAEGQYVRFLLLSRQRELYTARHQGILKRLATDLHKLLNSDSSRHIHGFKSINDTNAVRQGVQAGFQNIIGSHPALLSALDMAAQVASFNTSVLILGETGTGKERIAESIHAFSPRKNKPFIKVNCAAIPATLIESELFGHEKGAFTDANTKRKGKFELADGGTIFLDEIGELPLQMQVKLLRVLQEKEIDILGNSTPLKVNIRVVAATNRDLEKEVSLGNFRLDLYYRLNVFPIRLPSLRERSSDIEPLANFFGIKFCHAFNKKFFGLSRSMLAEMQDHQWPGNVRELENVMERAVILNDGASELMLNIPLTPFNGQLSREAKIESLQDVKLIQRETERAYLISVLRETKGRVRGPKGAAQILDLKATTLEAKIAKFNIRKDDLIN